MEKLAKLTNKIVPYFTDVNTEGPLLNKEKKWLITTIYRIDLAEQKRDWAEAERLLELMIGVTRQLSNNNFDTISLRMDDNGIDMARSLAISLQRLGNVKREKNDPNCIKLFIESFELFRKIMKDNKNASICAFTLGRAYTDISGIRDLAKAYEWYQNCIELVDETDYVWKGKCHIHFGIVNYLRFKDARGINKPKEELLELIRDAIKCYHAALGLIPSYAAVDISVAHFQLGVIYTQIGYFDHSIFHFNQSIRIEELLGNYHSAGQARFNIAAIFALSNRVPDALDYARVALRNFEMYGDRAADMIEQTKALIHQLSEPG